MFLIVESSVEAVVLEEFSVHSDRVLISAINNFAE